MNSRNAKVLALLVLSAFAFGLVKLFELRYRTGEVYPAYSTLRADPKGCKALFESMSAMPGYTVEQNLKPMHYLHSTSNATIILQGTSMLRLFVMIQQDHKALMQLMENGNRVVLTFPPSKRGSRNWMAEDDEETQTPGARKLLKRAREARKSRERQKLKRWIRPKKDDAPEEPEEQFAEKLDASASEEEPDDSELVIDEDLQDEFIAEIQEFIDFGFIEFQELPEYVESRRAQITDEDVRRLGEHDIPWNSTMVFGEVDDEWSVLAERDGQPVIIESTYTDSTGTVVVCSDSYFMSNESMLAHRRPALLLRLLGDHKHIIFDETHLGIARKPGIANLVGRYHLHGLVAGLALLAGLFIWRNSTSLIPIEETIANQHTIEGKDHAAGMINLLRRNIPGSKVFELCLDTWLDKRLKSVHGKRRERVKNFAGDPARKEAAKKQPLQTYKDFQKVVNDRG